jgi:hypothetical protein
MHLPVMLSRLRRRSPAQLSAWAPVRLIVSLILLATAGAPLSAQTPAVAAVIAGYDRAARLPLWPGFRPDTIPLAIFDGDTTWLVRHPAPPPQFMPAVRAVARMAGRYDSVHANSSAKVGGHATATLMFDPASGRPSAAWAATMIHEAFHVFQRTRHPSWVANEVDLFTYPFSAEGAQRLQRLETEAWHRAMRKDGGACWARAALEFRRLRFGLLPVASVAYERNNELNEGLATYIELKAQGRDTASIPLAGFGPMDVRLRSYSVGPAIAMLLDRLVPAWRDRMEDGPATSLDELLAGALPAGEPCRLPVADEQAARDAARHDIESLDSSLTALRDSIRTAPGWRIEVVADSALPLWPQGFDPWNVVPLGKGAVAHRRYLKLGKDGLSIEVLGHAALTQAAGEHPIFNGIRALLVTGLPVKPDVVERPGSILVTADGVRLEGRVADVDIIPAEQTVRLRAGP